MATAARLNPDAKKFPLDQAADELARLTELRDLTDDTITKIKCRILAEIGPLSDQHTTLKGKASQWDIRSLPTKTVAWKDIAMALNPGGTLVQEHTTNRLQVSFKRMPVEVSK